MIQTILEFHVSKFSLTFLKTLLFDPIYLALIRLQHFVLSRKHCFSFFNLYCLSYEVMVNWNDRFKQSSQLWCYLKEVMFIKQKLISFSYDWMPQGLLSLLWAHCIYILSMDFNSYLFKSYIRWISLYSGGEISNTLIRQNWEGVAIDPVVSLHSNCSSAEI